MWTIHRIIPLANRGPPKRVYCKLAAKLGEFFKNISFHALGMGIDAKGFNSLVVFGAQNSCSKLVQEIRRVGKDHQPSIWERIN